jgi:predicted transcriptional regulator
MEKVGVISVDAACHKEIGKTELKILIIISACSTGDETTVLSQAKLAFILGTQRSHINKSIAKLIRLGFVKTKRLHKDNIKSVLIYKLSKHVSKMGHRRIQNDTYHVSKMGHKCIQNDSLLTSSSSSTLSESLKDKGVEKTKSIIENDWLPDDKLIEWAFDQDPSLDVRLQTEKFINYHQRKRTKRVAWELSWKYWMNHVGTYSNGKDRGTVNDLGTTSIRRAGITRAAARADQRRKSTH